MAESFHDTTSMSLPKELTCSSCKCKENISTVKFPEDLYNLMEKYNLRSLLWICSKCELEKDRLEADPISCLSIKNELAEVRSQLSTLTKFVMNNCKDGNSTKKGKVKVNGLQDPSAAVNCDSLSASLLSSDSQDSNLSQESPPAEPSPQQTPPFLERVISKRSKIDPVWEKQSREMFDTFYGSLIDELKSNNSVFSKIYKGDYFSETCHKGLSLHDEFDVNVLLSFQFKNNTAKITPVGKQSGYASYELENGWNKADSGNEHLWQLYLDIDKHFVEGNFLMPTKVRYWLQSSISRINLQNISAKHVEKVTVSQNGPTHCFRLYSFYKGDERKATVNVTPVITFGFSDVPQNFCKPVARKFNAPEQDKYWFMIPEEYSGIQYEKQSPTAKQLWRIHSPQLEKYVIGKKRI